jgi:hypothetical protein
MREAALDPFAALAHGAVVDAGPQPARLAWSARRAAMSPVSAG